MDELDKSLPAAEGMVNAEESGNPKRHNENCLNCGTKLEDIFCHHCGQKDLPRRQSMRELIENFIGSFYSFESKFFKTVRYLLLKPGFLPMEYTNGKRESYYHPARAYVFISFVFFLLFFSLPNQNEESIIELGNDDRKELNETIQKLDSVKVDSVINEWIPNNTIAPGIQDSIKKSIDRKKKKNDGKKINTGFTITPATHDTFEQYDSAQQLLPEDQRDGWFTRKIEARAIKLNQQYKGEEGLKKFGQDFTSSFKSNFSTMLFYLLPIFAVLLKLLYMRRDFYYSEHLVFSIYYYNFFYLAGCFYLLINLIPSMSFLNTILILWIIAYLFIGMKRMYQQSWGKTLAKFFLFGFLFMIAMTIAASINAALIILTI